MKLIGEAAINWRDLEEAKEIIEKCADLGFFAVKFQLYDETNVPEDHPIHDEIMSKMLDSYDVLELYKHGKLNDIEIFFTVMYFGGFELLRNCEINEYVKIRHMESQNHTFIKRAKDNFNTVIVSTDVPYRKLINLLCIPEYPAKAQDYILKYRKHEGFSGFSDHTDDLTLLLWAQTLPNSKWMYFEKHICLSKEGLYEAPWSVELSELEAVLSHD